MSKSIPKKLNQLISKLIILLDRDIAELGIGDIQIKKDISAILSRLTTLQMQLYKIKDNEGLNSSTQLNNEDFQIIERFIEKHK